MLNTAESLDVTLSDIAPLGVFISVDETPLGKAQQRIGWLERIIGLQGVRIAELNVEVRDFEHKRRRDLGALQTDNQKVRQELAAAKQASAAAVAACDTALEDLAAVKLLLQNSTTERVLALENEVATEKLNAFTEQKLLRKDRDDIQLAHASSQRKITDLEVRVAGLLVDLQRLKDTPAPPLPSPAYNNLCQLRRAIDAARSAVEIVLSPIAGPQDIVSDRAHEMMDGIEGRLEGGKPAQSQQDGYPDNGLEID